MNRELEELVELLDELEIDRAREEQECRELFPAAFAVDIEEDYDEDNEQKDVYEELYESDDDVFARSRRRGY